MPCHSVSFSPLHILCESVPIAVPTWSCTSFLQPHWGAPHIHPHIPQREVSDMPCVPRQHFCGDKKQHHGWVPSGLCMLNDFITPGCCRPAPGCFSTSIFSKGSYVPSFTHTWCFPFPGVRQSAAVKSCPAALVGIPSGPTSVSTSLSPQPLGLLLLSEVTASYLCLSSQGPSLSCWCTGLSEIFQSLVPCQFRHSRLRDNICSLLTLCCWFLNRNP